MRSFLSKIVFCIALLGVLLFMESCANAHWGTSMGVNMSFGPGGPRVTPSLNVGMYSGGRY